jgi:hypothetical protein
MKTEDLIKLDAQLRAIPQGISAALHDLAGQENNNGPEYDLVQLAGDYISYLEEELQSLQDDLILSRQRGEDRRSGYNEETIMYPVDIFYDILSHDSPYATYLFQWVPYQTEAKQWRLKMLHDAKTFDGREAFGVWPNSSSMGPFKDHEVEFIRISREQHGHTWTDPRAGKENENG